jgi:heat shock protein HslJ
MARGSQSPFAENKDSVGWRAGCNHFGANVEVTDDHLDVGQVAGTQIGCPAELQRQDEWVLDFFASDPAWQLSDQGLMLSSDDSAIEFEAN